MAVLNLGHTCMFVRKSKEKNNWMIDVAFMKFKTGSHFSKLFPSECLRDVKEKIEIKAWSMMIIIL